MTSSPSRNAHLYTEVIFLPPGQAFISIAVVSWNERLQSHSEVFLLRCVDSLFSFSRPFFVASV